jgi:hypothetical protein
MGSKQKAPPAPDYSGIAAASEASAQRAYQLGEDQLQWAKDQYAQDRSLTDKVVQSAIDTQNQNAATAAADRARYEQTYQPLEDQLVKTAQDYSSPDRQSLEMGRAAANVNDQFNAQRNAALQNLEGFGVDPSSTRYAALDIGQRATQAAAAAAAANQARQATEATGQALTSEAINVGRGYPGQIAGQYGTSLQAGNQAVNSNLATTASGAQTMGTGTQYMGLGNQAVGVAGGILGQQYQNQLAGWQANQSASSGIGSLLGTVGSLAATTGWATGGAVPARALPVAANDVPSRGGTVPRGASPSRGAIPDDVDAKLTAGEFVIPADVRSWKGEEFYQKHIAKARQDRAQQSQARPTASRPQPVGPTRFMSRPGQQQALPLRAA